MGDLEPEDLLDEGPGDRRQKLDEDRPQRRFDDDADLRR